ncbi:hypothetical protein JZO67_004520 [Enterococcus sp. 665A]|uniref:Transposase n=1 Tax=Candidatus Enterococcus ferrettii TaxID=2815324 RepID=A0ABV0EV68_9ENTE
MVILNLVSRDKAFYFALNMALNCLIHRGRSHVKTRKDELNEKRTVEGIRVIR